MGVMKKSIDSSNHSMLTPSGPNSRQGQHRALPVPSSPQNFTMDKKSNMTKPPQPKTKPYQMSTSKQPKPLGAVTYHSGSTMKLPTPQNITSVPSLHTTKNRNLASNKLSQFGNKMKK